MFTVSDRFLQDVGLVELPSGVKEAYKRAIRERIAAAVVARVFDDLDDDQLEELAEASRHGERAQRAWLHIHVPESTAIAREEVALLGIALATDAPELVALERAFALEATDPKPGTTIPNPKEH